MAVVCNRVKKRGQSQEGRPKSSKLYLAADEVYPNIWADETITLERIHNIEYASSSGPAGPLTIPDEEITGKSADQVPNYGMAKYCNLFLPRQLLLLMSLTECIRSAYVKLLSLCYNQETARAILT